MRLRNVLAWSAIVMAAFVTASTQADLPLAKAETVGMSSKRLERINTFIKDYVDTNQIAGAVTLVARKGKIVHFEAQGSRFKEENQPMEKDAIFSLASMTKPIVSTALMMLWEDGKFMLDDPIAKWLPSYAHKQVLDPLTGRRTPARPVTVRHILSHTSGLSLSAAAAPPPLTDSPADDADGDPLLEPEPQAGSGQTAAPARPRTLLEAVERAAGSPLAFQPGERWQYGSSTDFVAILDEKMSGMTIDEFVRTKIFQPLGMRDTFYNVPREKVAKVAAIYRPDKDGKITLFRKPEYREPTTYFPGVAGLNGTAADYFRFSQMLLNGGEYGGVRILRPETVARWTTPGFVRSSRALGWDTPSRNSSAGRYFGPRSFGHTGYTGTSIWIDPERGLFVILLTNRVNPTSENQKHVALRRAVADAVQGAVLDAPLIDWEARGR